MDTREAITLDARAQQRLRVLGHVHVGKLAATDAALAGYRGPDGGGALVHGNRGRLGSGGRRDLSRLLRSPAGRAG